MESGLYFIGLMIVLIVLYRQVTKRVATPQVSVRLMLRRFHAFQKMGLSEQESLFRILRSRSGWRNLPEHFLAEIIARLRSKEDVLRFVSLAEGYRFNRERLPAIAGNENIEAAMRKVALWLVSFGQRLRHENRLKQAEFVQKLALSLEPERYFTHLALAATYHRMARYSDAAALFERAFAQLDNSAEGLVPADERNVFTADGLVPNHTITDLKARYQPMYEACLNGAGCDRGKPDEGSSAPKAGA